MLTKCPECELQVSDKASFCPHCGYPFSDSVQRRPKKSRRRRLPNGFGQITELKNSNLRKPFRAMVTVGKDNYGKPICKLLKPNAYFETYNEAYEALLKYNKDPYKDGFDTPVSEVFEKWFANYNKSESRNNAIKVAWKYCHSIYNIPIAAIRTRHLMNCIENGSIVNNRGEVKELPESMRRIVKYVLGEVMAYAVAHELADRNYVNDISNSSLDVPKRASNKVEHKALTNDEMKHLWANSGKGDVVDMILIQCYTGLRPSELISIKLSDVDMEKGLITCGMKTEAGKNRLVPIHSAIFDLVKKFYALSEMRKDKYLFASVLKSISYNSYAIRFGMVFPEHKPHDPRKQFVTMAKEYKMDLYAIKRIIGHKIDDITESIYTQRDYKWLKEEIEKIIVQV